MPVPAFDRKLMPAFSIIRNHKAVTTCAESANKGVNQGTKGVTKTQEQTPESPTVTSSSVSALPVLQ